jgi:hypothetical protein
MQKVYLDEQNSSSISYIPVGIVLMREIRTVVNWKSSSRDRRTSLKNSRKVADLQCRIYEHRFFVDGFHLLPLARGLPDISAHAL